MAEDYSALAAVETVPRRERRSGRRVVLRRSPALGVAIAHLGGEADTGVTVVTHVIKDGRVELRRHALDVAPRRMQAGVDDNEVVFDLQHRLCGEPGEEVVAVGSVEKGGEPIVLACCARAGRNPQQVQVVIAEHHQRTEIAHAPQHPKRVRPAVDQIADAVQPIPRLQPECQKQFIQFSQTTLNVADNNAPHALTSSAPCHGFEDATRRPVVLVFRLMLETTGMSTTFWVGTSGYNYKEWKGSFYPSDLAEQEMLKYYAQRFSTVEINYTFYRMPNVRTLQGWAKETPEGFAFTLKAPRRITHDLRLRDAGDVLTYFCDTAKALKKKLGALLFQLPPFLKKDLPRLEDFLHQMPPGFRPAFEFRNQSWFSDDIYECLRRFDAALCIAEHDERSAPFEQTANFGYFRLRKPDYTDADLAAWAARLVEAGTRWSETFVYFKHEEAGKGPLFASKLSNLLHPHAPVAAGDQR
jgi:uncharacterized protein YecE (DUF72 family)